MNANFKDVSYKPLRLVAFTVEDLKVISAMTQDAALPSSEMSLDSGKRRFAMLLNRYRWEVTNSKNVERVQTILAFEDVKNVKTQNINKANNNLALWLLNISFIAEEDGMGTIEIILAGGGKIRLQVEALDCLLYTSPSPRD